MPLCTILTKWPGAGRAAVQPAVAGRREILEHRRQVGDRLVGPADHEAVADLVAPDAAGGAGVDEDDAALGERRRAALAVREARVAAVDEDVALAQEQGELVDRLLGHLARGHHRPRPRGGPRRGSRRAPRASRPACRPGSRASPAAPRSGSTRAPRGRRRAGGASCRRPCGRVRRRRSSCAGSSWSRCARAPARSPPRRRPVRCARAAARGRAARQRRRAPVRRAACGSRRPARGSPRRPARPRAAARRRRSAARPCGTGRSSAGSAARSRP